jgi:membrane associated rhomboid family serine protease/Zn-finger nucleic acid-binding protein
MLAPFVYSYNSKVKLDRCDRCNGIWTPLAELLGLIELARLSQVLEPDVRALGEELLKHHENIRRWKTLGRLGEELGKPVPIGWRRPIGIILPIGTDQEVGESLWATYGIVLANFLVLAIFKSDSVALAMVGREVTSGHRFWTVGTAIFAHDGFLHVAGNMFFLWLFGAAVETRIGWRVYLGFYLGVGLVTNLLFLVLYPHATVPLLGASGAVSAILGIYVFLFPHAHVRTFLVRAIVDVPAWIFFGVWFFMQFVLAAASAAGELGGVAWGAHAFGFFAGFVGIYGLGRWWASGD